MADTPLTPPSSRSFTDEERRQRYELLRRKSMLSRIYAVHRNPDWCVRWVLVDKHNQDITVHKHLGFDFAKDDPSTPEPKRQIDTVVPLSEDGFYRTGDVILMQIPRIDYEFYLAENVRLSRAMLNAGKEGFKNEARKHKFPTFDRDETGREQRFHND